MSEIESLKKIEDELIELSESTNNIIQKANTENELDEIRISILGKKGKLSNILKNMGRLSSEERPIIGQKANILKIQLQDLISQRKNKIIEEVLEMQIANERLDVTISPLGTPLGKKHPLISTQEEIIDIFCGLGYSVENGPEIESDFYNFESLNIPKDHPARDMQDTFYINNNLLLRTHTSPVQVRYLEDNPPPYENYCSWTSL